MRVRRHGIGIDAPTCSTRCSSMFAQVDRSLERPQRGLGVGLTLATRARRAARRHDRGAKRRASGAGATFVVRLPLASPAPPRIARRRAATAAAGGARRGPSRARRRRQPRLRVEPRAAADRARPRGARRERRRRRRLDVAAELPARRSSFLDIGMPRLNGYEARRRSSAGTPAVARTRAGRAHRLGTGEGPPARRGGGLRPAPGEAGRSSSRSSRSCRRCRPG